MDLLGAISVTAGVSLLVYGIVKAESYGWGSGRTWLLLGGAAVLLAIFALIETRVKHPLVRLSIFRMRALTTANVVMLAVMGGMFGVFYFTSIYTQNILGYSPVKTGVAFLPMTIMIIVASGIAQRLIGVVGAKAVGITGMFIAAIGLVMLYRIEAGGSYWTQLLPGVLVLALGLGLTFVPLTLIATGGVQDDDAGLASGLFNTFQQVGGALGLAILTTVANSRTTSALDDLGLTAAPTPDQQAAAMVDGFHAGFLVGAGMLALGAIVLGLLVRKRDLEAIRTDQPVAVHAG